eukprot:2349856-Rhodomonas_salina.3
MEADLRRGRVLQTPRLSSLTRWTRACNTSGSVELVEMSADPTKLFCPEQHSLHQHHTAHSASPARESSLNRFARNRSCALVDLAPELLDKGCERDRKLAVVLALHVDVGHARLRLRPVRSVVEAVVQVALVPRDWYQQLKLQP